MIKKERTTDIYFQNLTELILKEEEELKFSKEKLYIPFNITTNQYVETERYKRINVSYIETKFISIRDKEQIVIQFTQQKLEPRTRLNDSLFSYSPQGRFDRSTECILYRVNKTNVKEIFN